MTDSITALEAETDSATDSEETLEQFLSAVERRAWHMAWLATRQREEALDVVQDTMLAFVRGYNDRPAAERRPLFYRILNNRLRDWGRRRSVRQRWMTAWSQWKNGGEDDDMEWQPPDPGGGPEQDLHNDTFMQAASAALSKLPPRQREAFLLREWEGLDVAATAQAMGVSTGSVKTHYFRAIHSLRSALEDYR